MSYFLSDEIKEKITLGETTYLQAREDIAHLLPRVKDTQITRYPSASAPPTPIVKITPDTDTEHVPSCFLFELDLWNFTFFLCFVVLLGFLCSWLDRWLSSSREFALATTQATHVFDSLHTALEREMNLLVSGQQNQEDEQPEAMETEEEEEISRASNNVLPSSSEELETVVHGTTGDESRPKMAAPGTTGDERRPKMAAQTSKSTKEFDTAAILEKTHPALKERKLTDTF